MVEPRWLSDKEQDTWRAFTYMRTELEAELERRLERDGGLSAADYAILVPLSEAPGRKLRPRDLARIAGWEKSRLSHQIRRMESRGLVERQACPDDARGSVVKLTRRGYRAIVAAAPDHVEAVREYVIDALSDSQLTALRRISERILGRIRAGKESGDDGSDQG
ncbi:MAG: MarR family transcriptional regulator [Candidatus Nanopelagicales bacterium]|nr:MarR family transcriptional regulator [Candidatus Nanopelagicales bacterium]